MKKTIRSLAALLAALMLLGLCACGAKTAPAEAEDTTTAAKETAAEPEKEAEKAAAPEETAAEAESAAAAVRTITDGNGREVEIPQTVETIV